MSAALFSCVVLLAYSSCADAVQHHWIHLDPRAIVTRVDCAEWAPYNDNYDALWRADSGATIGTDTHTALHLKAGDVSPMSAPELWNVLEDACAPEYGQGIGIFPHDEPLLPNTGGS